MRRKFFYLPLVAVFILTCAIAYVGYNTDIYVHPVRNSLYINLLASGVTVLLTSLIIERALRNERRSDAQDGLKLVNDILHGELMIFFADVGFMKDAIDAGTAFGATIDMTKRDSKKEYEYGLKISRKVNTQTFKGKHQNTAGWMIEPTRRLLDALDEVVGNLNFVLNYTDLTKLYKLKKEIASTLRSIIQEVDVDEEFDIVEGYYSPDEGYLSNRDSEKNHLSSMNAYYLNKLIKLALEVEKLQIRSPST